VNDLFALARQRELIRLLLRRDIVARTSGTLLGGLWMLFQPALQVAALWFLLDVVLKVRFPGMEGGFVGYYLTGMLPWLMISEILLRSLGVMTEYSSLYQRSVFPLAILPLVPWMVSGGIYTLIFVVVALAISGLHGALGALILMFALLLWLAPMAYFLAVIGLFVRDVQQMAPFVLTMLLYVTPILYLPTAFPEQLRWWLEINPFAHWMVLAHALVQGQPWDSKDVIILLLLWLVALFPALWLFRRSEPHMREAL